MSEQTLNSISLTARVLGAAFYYAPNDIQDIIALLSTPQWAEEWPYGSEEQKQEYRQIMKHWMTHISGYL